MLDFNKSVKIAFSVLKNLYCNLRAHLITKEKSCKCWDLKKNIACKIKKKLYRNLIFYYTVMSRHTINL